MFEINKKFLYIKIHYLLFNAGVVPLLAFGSIFAKQLGISALTLGYIYTIIPLISVCTKITLSGIADKYKKRRVLFVFSVLLCMNSSFFLSFINVDSTGNSVQILCRNETFIESCHNVINTYSLTELKKRGASSITCQLSCKNIHGFAEEICKRWWGEELCHDKQQMNVYFNGLIQKKHIFSLNHCLYGRIEHVMISNGSKNTAYPQCREDFQVNCTVKCDNYELMNVLRDNRSLFLHDLEYPRTWIIFVLYLVYFIGTTLNFSLSDTICFELLGDKPHLYGRQRWSGALGFGLMTLISGWLIDWFSSDSFTKGYKPIFIIACVVFLVDLVVVFKMRTEQKVTTLSVVKDVSLIFCNSKVLLFAGWCLFMGMFSGMCWEFLFWHLEDISTVEDLQWIRTLQGLAIVCNTIVGEIFMFYFSGWVIKRLGHVHAMSILLFFSSIRFYLYSILSQPVWVLPIELFSGFIFSMTYVLLASYSSLIALPGTESTVQASFGALFEGIGMALGGFFGGNIYTVHNGYVLFSWMSYAALLAGFLHKLIHFKLRFRSNQTQKDKNSSAVYTSPTDAINILNDTTSDMH